MSAGDYDFEIEQGATFSTILTIKDALGVVIDISTWTFRGQIRRKYDDGEVLASFSFSFFTDGTDGKVQVSMSDSVSSAIPVDEAISFTRNDTDYIYDIEAERADDSVVRLLQGTAVISPEVTRA